ncbi:MAG TPA: FKBP-type peptidyl-prolyl cis-trans isomerase [Candidatus Paceibacterota bacterium]|nr:FKBP-type peptidyl-prolyl cis-trans isomerase [Candidatus Paceibacterota bacterium]
MNEDRKWNVIVGVLAAALIVGGAYMMIPRTEKDKVVAVAGKAAGEDLAPVEDAKVESDAAKVIKVSEKPLVKQTNTIKIMDQDGVKVEIMKEGAGDGAKNGQTVVVHYTGMFTDGKVFDSSVPRGQPFPVKLGAGMVIEGWEKGLVGMKVGEKRRLTIPPELGYGAAGAGGVIPPNSTLVFDVELLEIK